MLPHPIGVFPGIGHELGYKERDPDGPVGANEDKLQGFITIPWRATVDEDGQYLFAVVLDWFSRRVLSWRLSIILGFDPRMEAAFCIETLEDALARHGKPEIFNTDQGS